ncbi:hypothetical protein V1277_006289 [Bradyrhizobium sp. AZCC 1588]|uniref:hypothetical protein n=1 Tax=unclassified Bradyrhizobium TaxID=2631580 RepID=UPI002FF34ECE
MKHDAEIIALSAETLAMQAVLAHVLDRVARVDPRLAHAIKTGFDNAANEVEHMAIKFGKAADPGHTVKAIAIVEGLRAATLGNQEKPRSGV